MKKQLNMTIEGNRGGDYLSITPCGGNAVQLEIGHRCVVTCKQTVPLEWLTTVLSEALAQQSIEQYLTDRWGADVAESFLRLNL